MKIEDGNQSLMYTVLIILCLCSPPVSPSFMTCFLAVFEAKIQTENLKEKGLAYIASIGYFV